MFLFSVTVDNPPLSLTKSSTELPNLSMNKQLLKYIVTLWGASITTAVLSISAFAETVAIYDLEGAISESGQQSVNIMNLASTDKSYTHFDIVESLNAALTDDDVKAVVLDVDSAGMSLAQVQELRRLLLKIRAAEKDVWIYTEHLSIQTALLGSAANHMTLLPEGNVALNGLYGESMYFKKMLDKVGVKVEVIHIGDFKSAGENFYRNGPSDYAQKQSDLLMDSMYEQIIAQIAEGRNLTKVQLKAIMDKGLITPEQALELKLVDHLEYRTDFIETVRNKYGEKADYNKKYRLPDLDGPEINGLMDLFKLIQGKKDKRHESDYVAVIALDGSIDNGSIAPVRAAILKAKRDENCKALVLRVNSPGGSALSSDVLWEATDEFKETKRPFIVSMGGVAASGGYYVAAGADHIYAEEGTITGSIGVVGMKFSLAGVMNELGITTHSTKRGKHADIMNTFRPYTKEEERIIRASMTDVYGTFKKRITDGRGDKIKGELEKLAGGRVYSGKDALAIGLVDEIGGLNEAINKAASMAKLKEFDTYLLPEPRNAIESLFSNPAKDKNNPEFISMTSPRISLVPSLFSAQFIQSPALSLLGPEKKSQIIHFIQQAESFRDQRVLLLAPSFNIQTK
jgi:protease-4